MENLHNEAHEDDDDSLESDGQKFKKKAKDLGSVLFGRKNEKQSGRDESGKDKDKDDEPDIVRKERSDAEHNVEGKTSAEADQETAAAHDPENEGFDIPELTPEEVQIIESQLVASKLIAEDAYPEDLDEPTTTEQAVNIFRQRIAVEGMSSDEALSETLSDIDEQEPTESDRPEQQPLPTAHASVLHTRTSVEQPTESVPDRTEYQRYRSEQKKVDALAVDAIASLLYEKRRNRRILNERTDALKKKMEKRVKDIKTNLDRKESHIIELASQANQREKSVNRKPEKSWPEAPRPAQTLTRQELLVKSERINVDNTNLRQVYETHLITERALRHIVEEYESGGNYKAELKKELLEHQKDFERDPLFRDRQVQEIQEKQGKSELQSMISKIEALSVDQAKDELAFYKAQEMHKDELKKVASNRQRTYDALMLATISALIAVILIMLYTRG